MKRKNGKVRCKTFSYTGAICGKVCRCIAAWRSVRRFRTLDTHAHDNLEVRGSDDACQKCSENLHILGVSNGLSVVRNVFTVATSRAANLVSFQWKLARSAVAFFEGTLPRDDVLIMILRKYTWQISFKSRHNDNASNTHSTHTCYILCVFSRSPTFNCTFGVRTLSRVAVMGPVFKKRRRKCVFGWCQSLKVFFHTTITNGENKHAVYSCAFE